MIYQWVSQSLLISGNPGPLPKYPLGGWNPAGTPSCPALTFYGRIADLDMDIYTYDEWFLNDEGDEESPVGTPSRLSQH